MLAVALLAGQVGTGEVQIVVSHEVESVSLVPEAGTELTFGRGSYGGQLDITPFPAGLAVVEETTLDRYLLGIAEVPSSWPTATLSAQAVAARSYLAWTLTRGRSTNGTNYDYDICASQQCQVYRGPGDAAASWAAAVARTGNEILISGGQPAQALYSSSAGTRTRSNQDVWGGNAVSYLQAVDSPEAGYTPYKRWELTLTDRQFLEVFAAGDRDLGDRIDDIALRSPGEGNGPESVDVSSDVGVTSISATEFRATLNIHGPEQYPELMPALRSDGRRWPQTILSYTFSVEYQRPLRVPVPLLGPGGFELPGVLTVVGEGWGHGVGMSQWGAMAMGTEGASYAAILEHYYGLVPQDGGDLVPDTVRVGLMVEERSVSLNADGPFRLDVPGYSSVVMPAGQYWFGWTGDGLVIATWGTADYDPALFIPFRPPMW